MFKRNKEMDHCMIFSIKLATVAFVIVVLKLWGSAMVWVHNTNIWWFVGAFVVFAIIAVSNCESSCCGLSKKKTKKK